MGQQKPKIVISEENKKKLDELGKKNDTYDDIIKKILEIAITTADKQKKEESKKK